MGFHLAENTTFSLVLKWKGCKLSEVTAHLNGSNCHFCTKRGEGWNEPSNRFILAIDKSFPGLKRDSGKGDTEKAFDSVIDEVVLFDFKGVQSRTAWILALSSLFQWFKRSTWSASALTRRLPLLLRTKAPNNATFYVSMAISPPFFNVFSVFLLLSGIRFIGRLVLHPVPSGARVKEAGILSLFPFVKRCVLGISMATHIRGHVNPAFWLCGFGIFLCVDSEWCGTFVTQSCNN